MRLPTLCCARVHPVSHFRRLRAFREAVHLPWGCSPCAAQGPAQQHTSGGCAPSMGLLTLCCTRTGPAAHFWRLCASSCSPFAALRWAQHHTLARLRRSATAFATPQYIHADQMRRKFVQFGTMGNSIFGLRLGAAPQNLQADRVWCNFCPRATPPPHIHILAHAH
eukprot:1156289-Pelagomonas_calceolata.AAC.2